MLTSVPQQMKELTKNVKYRRNLNNPTNQLDIINTCETCQ